MTAENRRRLKPVRGSVVPGTAPRTDTQKILDLLRRSGAALSPSQIGARLSPRSSAWRVQRLLSKARLDGAAVDFRLSGRGTRWWWSDEKAVT